MVFFSHSPEPVFNGNRYGCFYSVQDSGCGIFQFAFDVFFHILFDNKIDDQAGQADDNQKTKGIDKQQFVPDGKIFDQAKGVHSFFSS
jgi:hypothetical protein